MKSHAKKSGPKPGQISKREMMEVVKGLSDHGLGGSAIARLTGYHPSTVKHYMREMGVPQMTAKERVERIIATLPWELKGRAEAIRKQGEALDEKWGQRHVDVKSPAEGRLGVL